MTSRTIKSQGVGENKLLPPQSWKSKEMNWIDLTSLDFQRKQLHTRNSVTQDDCPWAPTSWGFWKVPSYPRMWDPFLVVAAPWLKKKIAKFQTSKHVAPPKQLTWSCLPSVRGTNTENKQLKYFVVYHLFVFLCLVLTLRRFFCPCFLQVIRHK